MLQNYRHRHHHHHHHRHRRRRHRRHRHYHHHHYYIILDYIRKEFDFDKFKRLIKTHYFKEAYSDLS